MIALSPTKKRILKWAGYPCLAIVTLVYAMHLTFPYRSATEKYLIRPLSEKYDVTVAEVSPGWIPGHMKIEGLVLSTRPEHEDQKPTTIEISEVDVNIGVTALIGGGADFAFDAEIGDGTVSGRVIVSGPSLTIELHTEGLPMETIPGADSFAGGVPIKGSAALDVDLFLPKGKWRDAEGEISLACEGCVMGDGVAKMRPTAPKARNAFSEAGFTLPATRLGAVTAKIEIKKGIACIDKFESRSPDGEMIIEGGIKFDDPIARSTTQLYAKFKIAEEYTRKHEQMQPVVAGIPAKARRSDGYFGYSTKEPIGGLYWKPAVDNPNPMRECGASGVAVADKPKRERKPKRGAGAPATGTDRVADRDTPAAPTPIDVDRPGGATPVVNVNPEVMRGVTPAPVREPDAAVEPPVVPGPSDVVDHAEDLRRSMDVPGREGEPEPDQPGGQGHDEQPAEQPGELPPDPNAPHQPIE